MHVTPPPRLIAALANMARMRSVARQVTAACARIYAELEKQGFPRGSVDRALDLIDTDSEATHEEMLQAQALLKAVQAPVQIELVGLYESAIGEKQVMRDWNDAGFWARFEGKSRTFRNRNEDARQAFFAGWDKADEMISLAAEADTGTGG